jgi:hypothetical protein
LANELGDLQQFKNERRLSSYIGLTPSEYSSGEHSRQGHITKQGKPILRKVLVQAGWAAIRCDKELQSVFERIAAKSGSKRAIVAVVRRLIGRIRACFRLGKLYETREITPSPKLGDIIQVQPPANNMQGVRIESRSKGFSRGSAPHPGKGLLALCKPGGGCSLSPSLV